MVNTFIRSVWFPLIFGTLVASLVFTLLPFEVVMPAYLSDIRRLSGGALLADSFTPVGYPVLLATGYRLAGISGIVLTQAIAYIVALAIFHGLLRNRTAQLAPIIVATGLVALHPYALLGIVRINDNGINILFIAVMAWWIIVDNGAVTSLTRAAVYGGTLGLWSSVRPNTIIFLLIAVSAPIIATRQQRRALFVGFIVFLGGFLLLFCATNYLGSGNPAMWPRNGPYNFFAGNNPRTLEALLTWGNAEPSIGPGFTAMGVHPPTSNFWEVSGSLYRDSAMEHIRTHPINTLANAAAKFWVLFAPDYRQAHTSLKKAIQTAIALPAIAWIAATILLRRKARGRELITVSTFVALFVAPFVIVNADARFRMPVLDAFFIVSTVVLISEQLGTRA